MGNLSVPSTVQNVVVSWTKLNFIAITVLELFREQKEICVEFIWITMEKIVVKWAPSLVQIQIQNSNWNRSFRVFREPFLDG